MIMIKLLVPSIASLSFVSHLSKLRNPDSKVQPPPYSSRNSFYFWWSCYTYCHGLKVSMGRQPSTTKFYMWVENKGWLLND